MSKAVRCAYKMAAGRKCRRLVVTPGLVFPEHCKSHQWPWFRTKESKSRTADYNWQWDSWSSLSESAKRSRRWYSRRAA